MCIEIYIYRNSIILIYKCLERNRKQRQNIFLYINIKRHLKRRR